MNGRRFYLLYWPFKCYLLFFPEGKSAKTNWYRAKEYWIRKRIPFIGNALSLVLQYIFGWRNIEKFIPRKEILRFEDVFHHSKSQCYPWRVKFLNCGVFCFHFVHLIIPCGPPDYFVEKSLIYIFWIRFSVFLKIPDIGCLIFCR